MEKRILYHTGFQEIREPDIRRGRANADFGQGFYLSANGDFSRRWARTRRGQNTYINTYELDCEGLKIKQLSRDAEWYEAIFRSRAGYGGAFEEYDVVVGPIANDTIYDTWGLSTSGMLTREQSLALLMIGPVYEQTVIRTDRAAAQLRFLSAEILSEEEVAGFRETVRREEEAYQTAVVAALEGMLGKE